MSLVPQSCQVCSLRPISRLTSLNYSRESLAQSIYYHIALTRGVIDDAIIVFHVFKPSSLSHVKVPLSKQILQALMVGKNMEHVAKQIVPLLFQGVDHSDQL